MLERKGHSFALDWYLLGVLLYELLDGYPPYYDKDR
jgi:serine/threonine protein kinase